MTVHDIQDQSGPVAGYLATYLLPFVGIDLSDIRNVIGVFVFLIVILAIFLRSDLAATNPTLYLTGWRVVRARIKTADQYDPVVVILFRSGSPLPHNQEVSVVRFGTFLVHKG
ncbi:MAG: hypothetical protein OXF99_01225 [bacterium]|nr:hypothetical protein [bacterium]